MNIVTLDIVVTDSGTVAEMAIVLHNVLAFGLGGIDFGNGNIYILANTGRNRAFLKEYINVPWTDLTK